MKAIKFKYKAQILIWIIGISIGTTFFIIELNYIAGYMGCESDNFEWVKGACSTQDYWKNYSVVLLNMYLWLCISLASIPHGLAFRYLHSLPMLHTILGLTTGLITYLLFVAPFIFLPLFILRIYKKLNNKNKREEIVQWYFTRLKILKKWLP